jgi:hypothetical protein
MMLLMLGWATLAAGQSDDPVKSSGPWVAKYEDQMCVLSRAYGADPAKLQFALRPMPGDEFVEILLVMPNTAKPFSRAGKARVELLPGGQSVEPYYRDYTVANGAKRMVRFFVKRSEISDLPSSTSLRIALDKETRHLALTRAGGAQGDRGLRGRDAARLGNRSRGDAQYRDTAPAAHAGSKLDPGQRLSGPRADALAIGFGADALDRRCRRRGQGLRDRPVERA